MSPRHELSMLFHHSFAVRLCFFFIYSAPFLLVSANASTGAGPPVPVHPAAGPLPTVTVVAGVASIVATLVSALKVIDDSPECGPLGTG